MKGRVRDVSKGSNQMLSRGTAANCFYRVVDIDRFISSILPNPSPELVVTAILCFALSLGSIYQLERTRRQVLERTLVVAACAGGIIGYAVGATSLQTLLVYMPWSFVGAVVIHQTLGIYSQDHPVRDQARTWTGKNDQGGLYKVVEQRLVGEVR